MQEGPVLSLSPSFDSYSSVKLAEIAARVIEEFKKEQDSDAHGFEWDTQRFHAQPQKQEKQARQVQQEKKNDEDEEDDEFEFAFVCRDPDSSPISADEIFYNGQIRPIYPIFDTDLLLSDTQTETNSKSSKPKSLRLPLRKLMIQERESASCSSSEADELEGVADGTYCAWTPKSAEALPRRCKKSFSTGSSRRWKFRDLLYRSNSDGKDTFVLLAASKKAEKVSKLEKDDGIKVGGKAKGNGIEGEGLVGHEQEVQYVRKSVVVKEGDKRRSLLPYRQDLVPFFANVNGLSRNLHPF